MFLEGKLPEIRLDPHTLAIATYALALVNSARANEFNTQLKTLVQDGGVGKAIVCKYWLLKRMMVEIITPKVISTPGLLFASGMNIIRL